MKRIAQFVALGTVLGLILSAIFIWIVDWFPTEGSQQSKNNFPLFIAITYVSFVIFAIVIVAMGYSLWKFRQRGPSDLRDGDPTHGNTLLEIMLDGRPLVIVVFFAVWGAKVLDDNEAHAANGRVITVIGYSFAFAYQLRHRRRLHAQRRPLRARRQDDRAAHGHPAVHARHEEPRGHPRLLGAGVGRQAGRDAGRDRQDGRHDLRHAHAHRRLRGAVHRAVRLRPRQMHFKNIHVLSQARLRQVAAGRPRPTPRRPARAGGEDPGLAVFNGSGCGGCHTFTPAKSSGHDGPVAR